MPAASARAFLDRLASGAGSTDGAIEEAIAEGFAMAGFLRGQERSKHLRGAQDTPRFRRRLQPPPEGGS